MPRIWNDSIEAHRRDVRDAVLDATDRIVFGDGVLAVTMSRVAEEAGIGRATLYKYFADVDSLLHAWHERQVGRHLDGVRAARERGATASERLRAVLEAFAHATYEARGHGGGDLVVSLHQRAATGAAHDDLRRLVRDVVADAAASGEVRGDVDPSELAAYCLHALAAAVGLSSRAAVHRLVDVTLAGLRPAG